MLEIQNNDGSIETADPDVFAAFVGRGVRDRAVWLKARKLGIGGSDAAAAVGLSAWKSPLRLYYEKRDEYPEDDLSENPFVEWGIILEDVVAQYYAKRFGKRVRRVNRILKSKTHPFMIANLDRVIVGERRGLECKTGDARTAERWGEDGSDEVPDHVMIQVQHDIFVAELDGMDVPVLLGGNDFRTYPIPRHEELIERLVAAETEFWTRVQNGDPPPVTSIEDAKLRWPHPIVGATKEADERALSDVQALIAAKAAKAHAEDAENDIKLRLMQTLGDAEILTYNGEPVLSWKEQSRSGYTVQPSTFRVMTPIKQKKKKGQ